MDIDDDCCCGDRYICKLPMYIFRIKYESSEFGINCLQTVLFVVMVMCIRTTDAI